MSNAGRPTKYNNIDLEKVTKLCRLGVTDKELSEFLDISEATLNNWKKEYPEFLESIKKGKIISDSEVVNSLYKRATGYTVQEDKIINDGGKPRIVKVNKEIAPDSTACFFWLKNRRKENWRDKQDIALEAGVNIVYAKDEDKEL